MIKKSKSLKLFKKKKESKRLEKDCWKPHLDYITRSPWFDKKCKGLTGSWQDTLHLLNWIKWLYLILWQPWLRWHWNLNFAKCTKDGKFGTRLQEKLQLGYVEFDKIWPFLIHFRTDFI